MTPEKRAQMTARRAALAAEVAQLEQMAVTTKKSAEDRERAIAATQSVIGQIDALLQAPPTKPRRLALRKTPTAAFEARQVTELARIPKTDRAELRVSIELWRGERIVDARWWFKPASSGDWVPSRKGVAIDSSKLGALIDGLRLAEQHLQAPE